MIAAVSRRNIMQRKRRESESDKEPTNKQGHAPEWPLKHKVTHKVRTVYSKFDVDGTFVSGNVKRTFGPRIPLLFTPLSKELTFHHANSHEIRHQVVNNGDEWPPYRKVTRTGCFAISVRTGDAASRLLELTSLAGVPCKVSIPRWYSSNVRKIQGVPQRYSERQLLEHFYGIGVIYVRRQIAHRPDRDGTVRPRPQQGVILYFRPNVELPSKVRLGLVSFDLLPFMASPTQCMNCQRYFHIARHCDSPTRCKICAGFHNFRMCTRRDKVRCCNCLGRHVASFAGCPTRLKATCSKWRNVERMVREKDGTSSAPGDKKNKS